jgi:hypothetical protein
MDYASPCVPVQTGAMKSYGQYCPIARASEVFAERWTPLIVRNIFLGCETFSAIEAGAPGIPRSLLRQRLSLLEQIGGRCAGRESAWARLPLPAHRGGAGVVVRL